jgi:hypothetical protein
MLYIPTIDHRVNAEAVQYAKGELYNLDLNEFIKFQFNPNSFEWHRDIKWGEHNWVGNSRGGDVQFINLGPRIGELELLFMSDPTSPSIDYSSDYNIMNSGLVNFSAIEYTIEKWISPLPLNKRPSRIALIIGNNIFKCVILSYDMRITEFFRDLSPKEAFLGLELREWLI